ncbi:hypothetical protein LGM43_26885 [Burkholderia seminalis]|uniref:hypothetical protein n=1 Tax=Burkholderia seminalis TaxID=488731 RepID=UPI001CF47A6B|nr:hypothetical protein [Burkholderia seminalis]MCA7953900.1 hypothetical protein [Burkholderia seminalis]
MTTGNENSPLTRSASGHENRTEIEARGLSSADNGMPCQNFSQENAPAPEQASHAADERVAWGNARESLAVAMAGFASRSGNRDFNAALTVLDAITEPGLPLSWLRTARAASANETGADGVRAWETDDGRAISDEQKQQALRDGGASASSVRPFSIALGRIGAVPALAAEAVAIPDGWKLVPIEPTVSMVVDGFESWPDPIFSTPEEWGAFEKMTGCQQATHKARLCYSAMLAAAPQPAQAEVRVGLTDALRRAREELSIVEWENDPPSRVVKLFDEIDALLAAHPGQPEPAASPGVIAAALAVIEADRSQTLTNEHVDALDIAIKIQRGMFKLPEPRAEVTDAMLKAAALAYDAFPCPTGESVGRGQHLGQLRATLQAAIDAARTGTSS